MTEQFKFVGTDAQRIDGVVALIMALGISAFSDKYVPAKVGVYAL